MSGRSAGVRIKKTKAEDLGVHIQSLDAFSPATSNIGRSPYTSGRADDDDRIRINQDFATIKTSNSSGSDDLPPGYARVQRPHVTLKTSQVEKSSFRDMLDRKSVSVRRGIAKTFTSKKKDVHDSNPGSVAGDIILEADEEEAHKFDVQLDALRSPPEPAKSFDQPEFMRHGPPQVDLPLVPLEGRIKRWAHNGSPPTQWNKLRKDPELWNRDADTVVFLASEHDGNTQPSFRVSSYIIENTSSGFLISLLTSGRIPDDMSGDLAFQNTTRAFPASRQQLLSPSAPGQNRKRWDGSVSYELYVPAESADREEALRHQITTRNIFAMLYANSLVGLDFYDALTDMQRRVCMYWDSATVDPVGMMLRWIGNSGLDDCRGDPARAAALLRWCEEAEVNCPLLWREAYVHAAGQYGELEKAKDFMAIAPMTRHSLYHASNELLLRIQRCEERLFTFDPGMWQTLDKTPSRTAYQKVQTFFVEYYKKIYGTWPPQESENPETWLTRSLVKQLEGDIGALYNYLVNRDVVWSVDKNEEAVGNQGKALREWNMEHKLGKAFTPDTIDLPFTDLITKFDDTHQYPHIPCPYPLAPEPNQDVYDGKNLKMSQRVAALAYSESTNMYLMDAHFVPSALVEAFLQFEKNDSLGQIDPHAARRGRWLCIYGLLQTLATLSVDTSQMRHSDNVEYFLGCTLKRDPFNEDISMSKYEASHTHSFCWTVQSTWAKKAREGATFERPRRAINGKSPHLPPTLSSNPSVNNLQMHPFRNVTPSMYSTTTMSTDAGFLSTSDLSFQLRSNTMTTISQRSSGAYSRNFKAAENGSSATGYAAGIENLDLEEHWHSTDRQGQQHYEASARDDWRESGEQQKSSTQQQTLWENQLQDSNNESSGTLSQQEYRRGSPSTATVEEEEDLVEKEAAALFSQTSSSPSEEERETYRRRPSTPSYESIETVRLANPTRFPLSISPDKLENTLLQRPGNVSQRAQEFQEQQKGQTPSKSVNIPKRAARPMQEPKPVRPVRSAKEHAIKDFDNMETFQEVLNSSPGPRQFGDGGFMGRR